MKKLIFVISALALITLVSCQKSVFEQTKENGSFSLTATLEQPVGNDTRSYLDEFQVKWNDGDKIKVFDINGKYARMSTNDGGQTSALFKEEYAEFGFDVTNIVCAVYPFVEGCSYIPDEGDKKHGYLTFSSMLESQTYAENSFGHDANIAIARVDGTTANFTNACGLLRLSLKGWGAVKSVRITSIGEEALCGSGTISLLNDEVNPIFIGTETSPLKNSIVLNISSDCLLSESVAKELYIVVPDGCLSEGFEVSINEGKVGVFQTNKDNTIERSVIKAMPVRTIEGAPVPDYVSLVEYVQNVSVDTHISLPYKIVVGTEVTADFEIIEIPDESEFYVYGCFLMNMGGPIGRVGSFRMKWNNHNSSFVGETPASLFERVQTKTDFMGFESSPDFSPMLFGSVDAPSATTVSIRHSAICRIYGYTDTVNDDIHRLKLIPCYNSNTNKYCLFDIVSGDCLYPTSGPDLTGPALD